MSSDEEDYKKRGILESNGVKHEVEFYVENNDTLVVQVEHCHNHDRWIGKYDSSYIEELSHKTGNFKQFEIFCNMLESSLLRNSDSVMLDILSYEDLKVLREQKLGAKYRKPKEKTAKLQTKRYLIMTYTVEFDQIHYPLPLTYTGSSDSLNLKNKIKQLQDEQENAIETDDNRWNKGNGNGVNKSELNKLINENKQLREELSECRKYMKEIGGGAFAKELKVLKKVIQNLETDLLRERNRHQHAMSKKKKDYDKLMEEFEDLKANERNYRVRCESLTEELAMMKRDSRSGLVRQPRHNSTGSSLRNRNNSRERGRPSSNPREGFTKRSTSRERSGSASSFQRTPSPGGLKRFDPSAYIREREKKRKENEVNRSGGRRTPLSSKKTTPVSYNHLTKPPCGGSKGRNSNIRNSTRKTRSSSLGSDAGSIIDTKTKKRHSSERCSSRRDLRSDTSDDEYYQKKNHLRSKERHSSTKKERPISGKGYKTGKDDTIGEHAIGIAEIDARLEALQKFMQDNIN